MSLQIRNIEYYLQLANQDPYWKYREKYLSKALEFVYVVQKKNPLSAVLEIGANGHPLVEGCDTIDVNPKTEPTVLHDAKQVPWPNIKDGHYDLFVALQTWEHLGHRQLPAFREARRVSKFQLLSFPLNWNDPNDVTHYGITEELIRYWTDGVAPLKQAIIESNFHKNRLVMLFGRKTYFSRFYFFGRG